MMREARANGGAPRAWQMNGQLVRSPLLSPLYSLTLTAIRAGFLIGPVLIVKRESSSGQTFASCALKVRIDACAPMHMR